MADPSTFGDDRSVFLSINEWAKDTPWLHAPLRLYAGYGVVVFAALIVAGYVIARRRRSVDAIAATLWTGLATLLAVGLNQPIASGVGEPRPFTALPHILVLAHRSTDPSFASDHATMAGAVAVGLFFVSRRLGVVASVLALLMAFARVYVGAHYPVDVVAGLLLGGVVAAGGWLVLRGLLGRVVRWSAGTPLRAVVPLDV